MQLKKKPAPLRRSLAVATASLLGGVAHNAQALEPSSEWEIDSALLLYAESDRVSLAEPLVRVRKDMGDDRFLTVQLVIDALTGSSANGAIPTGSAQTFTSPSGNSVYTAQPNEVPLDPSFRDTRGALNAEWETPLSEDLTAIFGFNFSNEFDYQSAGLSATFNWDTNQKNTTWTFGVGFNTDTVKPVGGVPVAFTNMPVFPAVKATQGSDASKDLYDLVFGWSQVMSRRDLLQLTLSYGNESGYLTDPYKILSVVDGGTGALVANPAQRYRFEKRPADRTRQSLLLRWSHQFEADVLRLSYRYYTDDWGIDSHTLDARYRWELASGNYIEPHVRYYVQSAADFYHTSLIDGQTYDYASADYRLADMTTITLGLKYGMALSERSEFSVRAELMQQSADPSQVIGVQSQQDLVPDVDAVILQFGYTLQF